jgi:hypothetical protein
MSIVDAPVAEQASGYDAFISYRRSDGTAAARRIRAMLQHYRLPRTLRAEHQQRLTVFLDTAYERGAADFYEQTIRPALLSSRWLVVVATPDAVRRTEGEDWISREVADFSAGPNAGNVVVVRARGEFIDELPADIASRYPNVQIIDLREEGFLSRLSPQRNARLADEELKLVGPLFGVALEDMPRLRREEEKRQMGRLGALAGASVATLVLVAGLSVFALRSQWEGAQALGESLRSARGAIIRIVAQMSPEEALDAPIHEAVLEACDVSTRLTALSNTPPDPDASLACALEESRAIGIARPSEAVRTTIRETLEREDARAVAGGDAGLYTPDIVRTGYSFWAGLAERDGVRDAVARRAWAAFERRRAAALVPDTAAEGLAESDIRLAIIATRRAWTVSRAAGDERRSDGDPVIARSIYNEAAGDARLGFDLLTALEVAIPGSPELEGGWLSNAERAILSASDIAVLAERGSEKAQQAFRDILPHLEVSDALGGRVARQAFRASALSGALLVAPPVGVDEDVPADLWDCLSLSHAALKMLPEREDTEFVRTYARQASEGCVALSNEALDTKRNEVYRLADAGDTGAAAVRLEAVIDHAQRALALYDPASPWDSLYVFVALRDLAQYRQQQGDREAAETARLRALPMIVAYVSDLDAIDEKASLVAEVKRAWDDLWNGHYGDYIDVLRGEASSQPPEQAIATLRKVIASDVAWDSQMPALSDWDRVWRAGVMLELADLLAPADPAAQTETLTTAYDLVAPLNGNFDNLDSTLVAEAQTIWSRLVAWKDAA